MRVVTGFVIVAAHLAGFVWFAERSRGTELDVAEPALVIASGDGGPGLVHRRWTKSYRGGHTRSVGATQLVGPFQDPAQPACTGRVVIGQRLLDDGKASDDTIAGVMKQMIDRELRGQSIFPIGDYKRISRIALRWVKDAPSLRERRLLGKAGAPDGFVRAQATVTFDRADVPVLVALVPERTDDALTFRIAAEADLDFDNRVIQWVSDKVGADEIATKIAREQVDDVLVTTFAPPPPFELSEGQTLQFTYCDAPPEIVDGAYGALPFGIAIGRTNTPPEALPPRFGTGSRPAPAASTLLALDLDLDALDAMLFELWRTGWLDKRLAEAALDRRFNTDPIVTEYLSIRISPPRLALPPVIASAVDGSLRLAADARVEIDDGGASTTGRVYGALDFRFAEVASNGLPVTVEFGALELSCERTPATLVPCYGDLVAALRDRGHEFHGALTEAFAALLADIFVERRIGAEGLPAAIVIDRAVPSLAAGDTLHLELEGKLVPVPVIQYSEMVDREGFREALLAIMERKVHWAWSHFTSGRVAKQRLHLHFEQEYATYVRDFPVMVGWAYVQCPIAEVRRDLAENLYEEETGGVIAGKPHPELFLEYPRGLGMDLARFERVELLPAARDYRATLDELTQRNGWAQAAAVTTIFIEGTDHERGELDPNAPKRPAPPLEDHPLVKHYGLPLEGLALTKAHRRVEGSHRAAAWRMILDHVKPVDHAPVLGAMERALAAWQTYRDAVAAACGVTR